jgi:drug/metabolite transporter (DMT)-like permease
LGRIERIGPPGAFHEVLNARAATLMLALAAIWGSSYLFIKIGVEDGLSPSFISFARLALGALVLFPIAAHSGALRGLRGNGGTVAFLGAVQMAGPFLLITVGERWISSSLAGILVASAPIFIALLALWVDSDERSAGVQLLGIGAGIAGVTLLLGVDVGTGGLELLGGLLVLVASLGYAVGALALKRRLGNVQPVAMAAGAASAGAAYLLLPAIATFPAAAPSLGAAVALVALGVGGTGLAFLVYFTLIAHVGAARASVVAYLAPGFAVLYGVTLRDEIVTAWTLLGLALVLGGSWLASRPRTTKPRIEPVPAAVGSSAR